MGDSMKKEDKIMDDFKAFSLRVTTLPSNWRAISKLIIARDHGKCQKCESKKALGVHHVDQDQSNNDEKNLITICDRCHKVIPVLSIGELYLRETGRPAPIETAPEEDEYVKPEVKVYRPVRAIKLHCLDCAGETRDEVIGCQILDCALWPWRLGCTFGSTVYRRRVIGLFERGGELVNEIRALGLDMPDYLELTKKRP